MLERYLELAAQDKAAAAMLVKERRDNVVQMLKVDIVRIPGSATD